MSEDCLTEHGQDTRIDHKYCLSEKIKFFECHMTAIFIRILISWLGGWDLSFFLNQDSVLEV